MRIETVKGTASKTGTRKGTGVKGTSNPPLRDRLTLARALLRSLPFKRNRAHRPRPLVSCHKSGPGSDCVIVVLTHALETAGRQIEASSPFFSPPVTNGTLPRRRNADRRHLKNDIPTALMVQGFGNRLGAWFSLHGNYSHSNKQISVSVTANSYVRPSLWFSSLVRFRA